MAIVTGASRGIGRGIAVTLARQGASVVLTGRDASALTDTANEVKAVGGTSIRVLGDIGLASTAERLMERTARSFGRLDILVNNAAWANPTSHFLDLDEKQWDQVIRTNLKSVYLCSRAAALWMVRSKREGTIVNISSFGAVRSHRQMAAYDAAKGAIESFTRTVALDLAPFGIRVNCVGPGAVDTAATTGAGPNAAARRAVLVPLGRLGTPAEIGQTVCFLASEEANYITGQCIYVDGGVLAQLRPASLDLQLPNRWSAAARHRNP